MLAGLVFSTTIDQTGEASMRAVLGQVSVLLLFVVPMITMRQLAEEERAGTLELLMTAPLGLSSLVLGKWAAATTMGLLMLATTAPMVLILSLYGTPDPGVLLTGYLAWVACVAAFSAAGLFVSSLTRDATLAGVGAILLLLPAWLADVGIAYVPVAWQPVLSWMSMPAHLARFSRGVLDLGDVAWFAGWVVLFLFLSWRSLESRRWR